MAIAQVIQSVLDKWDYARAYEIFKAHSTSTFLISLLENENTFNNIKLRNELEAMIETPPEEVAVKESAESLKIAYDKSPEEVKLLISERIYLFNKMKQTRKEMLEATEEVTRRKHAFEILDLDDKVNDIWEKLHHYEKHGFLPKDEIAVEVVITDRATLKTRWNTLGTYLSKAKRGHKRHASMVAEYEAERKEIERKLAE